MHHIRTVRLPAFVSLFALLVLPALSQAQTVTRGPYLQSAAPTSVVVKWRTDVATDSAVGYATVSGTPNSVADVTATTEHEVTLIGLSADTLYNYTIGTTTAVLAGGDLSFNGDGEHFFTTPPVTGTDKSTRIWVIGDSGTATEPAHPGEAAAVRDAYKNFTGARGTDVWLMLGDNAYNSGTDAQYQVAVFDTYPQLLRQNPVWSALGNHDGIDIFFNPPGAYPQIFTLPTAGESGGLASGSEFFYSFDYGNIHFIALDSSSNNGSRAPGSPMLNWLTADLAATTQDWIIAFWHHPEYSKGSHDSDAEVVLQEMRENVVPILESGGVDLILSGHSHSYERSFLVDGHHGLASTLTPAMLLNDGDGNPAGDGAYIKPGPAGTPNEGAVHAVVGSSGKTEAGGTLDHPVMYTSQLSLGSLVLDIFGNRLDAAFVDDTGTVQDEFTILKALQVVDIDVDPWSDPNIILPESNEAIPVSIQGMSVAAGDAIDFDATMVDAATVKLGAGNAMNQAAPWIVDIDGDAETDMVLGYWTQDTGIVCNDTEVSVVGGTLTGETFTGTDTIDATDCLGTGCHP